MSVSRSPRHRLALGALVMVAALLAQFSLGMVVNLYVTIPAKHPGAHPTNFFTGAANSVGWAIGSGVAALAIHVVLGLVLVVTGFILISLATSERRGVVVASALGPLFILGAAFNGASFLSFNNDISSLIMALLFAAALACYVAVIFMLYAPTRRSAA